MHKPFVAWPAFSGRIYGPRCNDDYVWDVYREVFIGMAKPEFRKYQRCAVAEMAEWEPGFDMSKVSVSKPDKEKGSPKFGDMIARNPSNHEDMWLVSHEYFIDNFDIIPK